MNRKLINSRIYLLVLPLIVLFVFNGKKYDAAVIDRINIPVRVCIQGEDCGAPLISASDMLVDSKGTKLYAGCIACHGTGGEGKTSEGEACTKCKPGNYQSEEGQAACNPCPANQYYASTTKSSLRAPSCSRCSGHQSTAVRARRLGR